MAELAKTSSPVIPPTPPLGGKEPLGLVGTIRIWVREAFVDNAALKFVALVLALTVFVLVQNEESEVYHPWVSITYSQSENRVLTSKRVDQVQLSIRGTHRRVQRLQRTRLESISVDLKPLSTGELRFEPEMFDLPEGVELVSIHPPSMYLEFDERDEKTVPVTVNIHGSPMRGFKLGSAITRPVQVRVTGARRVLAEIDSVSTERVDLTGRRQNFRGNVKIIAEEVEVIGSQEVEVSVQIIEELDSRVLEGQKVVIHSLNPTAVPAGRFRIDPKTVTITMFGSLNALEAVATDSVEVYVNVSAKDLTTAGPVQVEPKVTPVLSDIAYKVNPALVTLLVAE